MEWHLVDGSPELEVVSRVMALVAVVTAERYVDRKRSTILRRRFVQRAVSVPLFSAAMRWDELQ